MSFNVHFCIETVDNVRNASVAEMGFRAISNQRYGTINGLFADMMMTYYGTVGMGHKLTS